MSKKNLKEKQEIINIIESAKNDKLPSKEGLQSNFIEAINQKNVKMTELLLRMGFMDEKLDEVKKSVEQMRKNNPNSKEASEISKIVDFVDNQYEKENDTPWMTLLYEAAKECNYDRVYKLLRGEIEEESKGIRKGDKQNPLHRNEEVDKETAFKVIYNMEGCTNEIKADIIGDILGYGIVD